MDNSEKTLSAAHEIVLKRIRDIPSLPEVVNRMIQLLGEPNVPASKIAELISYDPGLTSKVLRMVNSAAYGFQRQISSIQHGIMILGFNTVRGLVLSASIFKLFEGQNNPAGIGQNRLDHYRFWRHCLGTAMAARLVANNLKGSDPRFNDLDDAFSAGMLHDIGKIVLDVYFSKSYSDVLGEAKKQQLLTHGQGFIELESRLMGVTHTQIGSYLASKWRLPLGISEVIACHHEPQNAQHSQPLVYLIALANQLAIILYEHQGIYSRSHFSQDVLAYFNYEGDSEPARLLQLLKAEVDSAEDLLNSISMNSPSEATTP
ncbi:MAG: HDOD domain-containing protein [Vampirovibrionales bacterium]|nr:HDOD domain-containing protein [Vampirovibrionales bacterium]